MSDKIFVVFTLIGLVALYGLYKGVGFFALLPIGLSFYALYVHRQNRRFK